MANVNFSKAKCAKVKFAEANFAKAKFAKAKVSNLLVRVLLESFVFIDFQLWARLGRPTGRGLGHLGDVQGAYGVTRERMRIGPPKRPWGAQMGGGAREQVCFSSMASLRERFSFRIAFECFAFASLETH